MISDEMYRAYKGALKALINSVPPEERSKRWKRREGFGYVIPELVKAEQDTTR